MDLNECYKKGLIKKTRKDKDLINSLIEMSEIKEYTVNSAKLNKINISAYISMAYDSLREILEALCISKKFKVLSHICIGQLLKDILKEFDYEDFNRIRWIRNSINYSGKKVELKQGKDVLKKIFILKKKIFNNYLKEMI